VTSRRLALGGLALALGVATEVVAFDLPEVHLWLPDLLVGWALVACGLLTQARRPASRVGLLLLATGLAWFVGNVSGSLVYLHRGVLVHLIVTFPDGRATSRGQRAAVASGYAVSLLPVVWEAAPATVVVAAVLVAYSAGIRRGAIGSRRRAAGQALTAAGALGLVLALGALARATLPLDVVGRPSLLAYQVVVVSIGLGLAAALLGSGSERTDVTDLVVELGAARSASLRSALADALGDPSLGLGYWSAGDSRYLGADNRPVALPAPGSDRVATHIERDGEPVAVLVHDPTVLEDPLVQEAVASAARLSAANVRLLAEVRARVDDVEASRRRLLATRDNERAALERRLHDGARRRLSAVADRLAPFPGLRRVQRQVEEALGELDRLARGIHPALLVDEGLDAALRSLVDRLPYDVDLDVEVSQISPEVDAAAYYVCAEGLANIAKHARATRARVCVAAVGAELRVTVEDDGVGGADAARGSGVRGLADRVETLGGWLRLGEAPGGGTLLAAGIPLNRS
jgi:signal transduction histidine kinase